MNKILFPTDFSEAAHQAFKYAIELAKQTKNKLDVIHIYPEPHKGKELYMDPEELRKAHKDYRKDMEVKMALFISTYDAQFIGKTIVFPSDLSADKVVERSKGNYDLIIMGTKGERNTLNKIIGSFTTKTMMNAHCPVLAVPSDTVFKGIHKIIYSTALQENDGDFLNSLSKFANRFHASIDFLHVLEGSEEKWNDYLKSKGISPDAPNVHLIKHDSVLEGVEWYVKEKESDVLALFIPKRSFVDRLFHRSLIKELTFHAALPLFVFKEK